MKIRLRCKELAQSLSIHKHTQSFELSLLPSSKRSLALIETKLQRMFGINAFKTYKEKDGKILIINNLKINNKKDEFNFFK